MSEVVEILKRAKERIGTPEKWCKYTSARDVDGCSVEASDPNACQWCLFGALLAEVPSADYALANNAVFDLVETLLDCRSYSMFNDAAATKHEDVMAFFDRAIALAESEAAMDGGSK